MTQILQHSHRHALTQTRAPQSAISCLNRRPGRLHIYANQLLDVWFARSAHFLPRHRELILHRFCGRISSRTAIWCLHEEEAADEEEVEKSRRRWGSARGSPIDLDHVELFLAPTELAVWQRRPWRRGCMLVKIVWWCLNHFRLFALG